MPVPEVRSSMARGSTASSPDSLRTTSDERLSLLFPPPKEYREKVLNIPSRESLSHLVNPVPPVSKATGQVDGKPSRQPPRGLSPPTPPPKSQNQLTYRRKSTKELVSLYEAKESKSRPGGPRNNPIPVQLRLESSPELDFLGRREKQAPRPGITSESRTRTPFPGRESIRTFLGAFNIAKKSKETPREFVVLRDKDTRDRSKQPLKTGEVVYRLKNPAGEDRWTKCIATLTETHLECHFPTGGPRGSSNTSLDLSACTGVQSLPAEKSYSADASEGAGFDMSHVFELELADTTRRQLATSSIKERGDWVSKIWDVIYAHQGLLPSDVFDRNGSSTSIKGINGLPLRVVNGSHLSALSGPSTVGAASNNCSSTMDELKSSGYSLSESTPSSPDSFNTSITFHSPEILSPAPSNYASIPASFGSSPLVQHLDRQSMVRKSLTSLRSSETPRTPSPSVRQDSERLTPFRYGLRASQGMQLEERQNGMYSESEPFVSPLFEKGSMPASGQVISPFARRNNSTASSVSLINPFQPTESSKSLCNGALTSSSQRPQDRIHLSNTGNSGSRLPSRSSLCLSECSFVSNKNHSLLGGSSPYLPSDDNKEDQAPTVRGSISLAVLKKVDDIQGELHSFGANLHEIASVTRSLSRSYLQDAEDLSSLNAKADILMKEDIVAQNGLAIQELHEIRETVQVLPHLDRKLDDLKNMMDATSPSLFSRRHKNGLMIDNLRDLPATSTAEIPQEASVLKVTAKLDEMDSRLRALDSFTRTNNVASDISAKLDLVDVNIAALANLPESVKEHDRSADVITLLENLTARLAVVLPGPSLGICLPDDLTELHEKLDALKMLLEARDADVSLTKVSDSIASLQKIFPETSNDSASSSLSTTVETMADASNGVDITPHHAEENHGIKELLSENGARQETLVIQASENARYLQQLNQWLEGFLQQHTTQTQTISNSVAHLLNVNSSSQQIASEGFQTLGNIHGLLLEFRQRDAVLDTMHHSLQVLTQQLDQVLQHAQNSRGSLDPQATEALLYQQHIQHEELVRALAYEISREIRGERLQFVEAMKEATSVNLHNQINEFKKQLSMEVVGMEKELSDMIAIKYMLRTQQSTRTEERTV